MDLKDRIEQRRKERAVELRLHEEQQRKERKATADTRGKREKQEAYLLARSTFAKVSKEEKQRLISDALNVINQNPNLTSPSNPKLSLEDAENLVEFAAQTAVEWWGRIVILSGIGFGMFLGFTETWGLGLSIAGGAIFMGALVNHLFRDLKKMEIIETHRLKIAAANLPQSQEVGIVKTEGEI